jgi:aspartate aminotransferase
MSESETLKMAQMARELKSKGHDVIALSLGEPDFDTPDDIKEAAWHALQAGHTKYTPVPGTQQLREAISAKFAHDNGLSYSPAQIVVSNGAKQSIYNICQALLDEGDEVIVFTPFWVSYIEIIKLAGGVPVCISAGIDEEFKVSASQLEAATTPRTKFILFSTPCNPTGSVFNKQELEAISEVVLRHKDLIIVADEIYEYIIFDEAHTSIGSLPGMLERTITVNGFSKNYAMTGWRLGYMGAPLPIAQACAKIQGQVTSGANSFSQQAGVYALENGRTSAVEMREAFRRRRDLVLKLLGEIPGLKCNFPQGAFYVFPDVSAYFGKSFEGQIMNNADDICDYIMQTVYVAVVAGAAFGAPDCFRISYAASDEELIEAVKRIHKALDALS